LKHTRIGSAGQNTRNRTDEVGIHRGLNIAKSQTSISGFLMDGDTP
jgi:hypothetical protein